MSDEENNNNINEPQAEYVKRFEQSDGKVVSFYTSFEAMAEDEYKQAASFSYEKRLAILTDLKCKLFSDELDENGFFKPFKQIIEIKYNVW